MTPWVNAWEEQATRQPDAVAVVNAHGQRCSFSHLQKRAHSQEHRLRMLGFDSGDRLLSGVDRHQLLDEIVVQLWACALRGGVYSPDWDGFTRRQQEDWGLREQVSPRVRAHSLTGAEEVFATPGPGWHDISFAWPERALEGGARELCPVEVRRISHAHLAHGMRRWQQATGVDEGMMIGWMDAGLSGISWLSLLSALAHGACLVQLPARRQDDEEWMASRCHQADVQWLVASPRWLSRMGLPWASCPQGILAPWGVAAPSQRWRWCERTQWMEVLDLACCGWWWGSRTMASSDQGEVSLDGSTSFFPWKVDARSGCLWVMEGEQWRPMAMVATDANGARLGLSGVVDMSLRARGQVLMEALRAFPPVGAVSCGTAPEGPYIALLPRSTKDNPTALLRNAMALAKAIDARATEDFKWTVACSVIPRDERGGFAGSSLAKAGD